MATLSKPSSAFNHHRLLPRNIFTPLASTISFQHISSSSSIYNYLLKRRVARDLSASSYRLSSSGNYFYDDEEDYDDDEAEGDDNRKSACSDTKFEEAVAVFNSGDYYKCHDVLEDLWNDAEEPRRTLFHGILQCAVGFYHLFNQNHKGAMMQLGEGLCKLRKMSFEEGPFLQFEQEISVVLEFIYQTQLELAACSDDFCVAIDQSERSYQLLGGFGAGQHLYRLETDPKGTMSVVFCSGRSYATEDPVRVKLPTLQVCREHLKGVDQYDDGLGN